MVILLKRLLQRMLIFGLGVGTLDLAAAIPARVGA
jgi:hypothetical protein